MGERTYFDEVVPFEADAFRQDYQIKNEWKSMAVISFLIHGAILSVLMYACSWLPLADKTPAYLVVSVAYAVSALGMVVVDILQRVVVMQRELLQVHDEVMAIKYEARERGGCNVNRSY